MTQTPASPLNAQPFTKVQAITGMKDVLPVEAARWLHLEARVRDWLAAYGYSHMRTPVLEHTPLFARGIGAVTDIVEKEMYTFADALNGDSLTLRPEMTAGLVRAAIEHNFLYERPQRVWALGPVFRHERPQRGRYRQFHQIDVEALGFAGPDVDAELILMLARLWKILGLKDIRLELNSLGQPAERAAHRQALIAHLQAHLDVLDAEARRRLLSNPLRVLDSKNPAMQDMANSAPRLIDFLGTDSRAHFDGVCARLDDAGVAWQLNPRLVRGLDYYNLTVFEWTTDRLGAQGTVCGGGRFDGLFELLGGKPTPAVGFAIGMERLLDLWTQDAALDAPPQCQVYVVHQGEAAQRQALRLAETLRDGGLCVMMHASADNQQGNNQGNKPAGFKAQFKRADLSGAQVAVILGEDEMRTGQASVKWLRDQQTHPTTQQHTLPCDQVLALLQSRLSPRTL